MGRYRCVTEGNKLKVREKQMKRFNFIELYRRDWMKIVSLTRES